MQTYNNVRQTARSRFTPLMYGGPPNCQERKLGHAPDLQQAMDPVCIPPRFLSTARCRTMHITIDSRSVVWLQIFQCRDLQRYWTLARHC